MAGTVADFQTMKRENCISGYPIHHLVPSVVGFGIDFDFDSW